MLQENDAAAKRVKRNLSQQRRENRLPSIPTSKNDNTVSRLSQEIEALTSELTEASIREARLQQTIQDLKKLEVELIKSRAERDGLKADMEEHVLAILDQQNQITKLQVLG